MGSVGDCLFTGPYSESQFKTLKYCPTFPERFGSVEDARSFCQALFDYYKP